MVDLTIPYWKIGFGHEINCFEVLLQDRVNTWWYAWCLIGNVCVGITIHATTLIIPISTCGIDSWNMHYYAKSQNQWRLKFLMSDVRFMNTCLFIIHFKKSSARSKVFVECIKNLYAKKEWFFHWIMPRWKILRGSFGGPNFIAHINLVFPSLISHIDQYYSSLTTWDNHCSWVFIANKFLLPFGWMHLKRQTCYWYHAGLCACDDLNTRVKVHVYQYEADPNLKFVFKVHSNLYYITHVETNVHVTLRRSSVLAWMHDNRELVSHVTLWNNMKPTLQ